jgi:hypothetical protein
LKDSVKILLAEIERLKKIPKPVKGFSVGEVYPPDIDKQEWVIAVKK